SELVERLDLERDDAEDRAGGAALIEQVAAEAGQALEAEAEVELPVFFEAVLLRIGEHAVAELLGLSRLHGRHVERLQVAVYAHLRRRVGGDVEIAAVRLQHFSEQ